ncbi:hypothetical protein EST38_g4907 [Candolleomyces aberdarensis]|uniref:Secreted protein n=1 Tax=Candolleomyces aberdarensis TaxID=2316362 RepID=A0A4Q2DLU1_9AGAR|nr:hypothetical protein EST38_g4907 [Candolleomyces aberdarensis]
MLKSIVSLLALASFTFSAPGASREKRVDFPGTPPGFEIGSYSVVGAGCPAGTTYWYLNPDKTAVGATFSEFFAEAGPGIPTSGNRKTCQLAFEVIVPAGFTFSISSVDYRVSHRLDSNVTATQQSTYYFQGETDQATARSTLTGPTGGDDYTFRDAFVSPVTSPCHQFIPVLYIDIDVHVENSVNPEASGSLAMVTDLAFNLQSHTCET